MVASVVRVAVSDRLTHAHCRCRHQPNAPKGNATIHCKIRLAVCCQPRPQATILLSATGFSYALLDKASAAPQSRRQSRRKKRFSNETGAAGLLGAQSAGPARHGGCDAQPAHTERIHDMARHRSRLPYLAALLHRPLPAFGRSGCAAIACGRMPWPCPVLISVRHSNHWHLRRNLVPPLAKDRNAQTLAMLLRLACWLRATRQHGPAALRPHIGRSI